MRWTWVTVATHWHLNPLSLSRFLMEMFEVLLALLFIGAVRYVLVSRVTTTYFFFYSYPPTPTTTLNGLRTLAPFSVFSLKKFTSFLPSYHVMTSVMVLTQSFCLCRPFHSDLKSLFQSWLHLRCRPLLSISIPTSTLSRTTQQRFPTLILIVILNTQVHILQYTDWVV